MKIALSGKNIDSNKFTYRDVGFGKQVDLPLYQWEAKLGQFDFFTAMRPIYDECINDLKRDDEITGEFDPPFPGAETYPDLESFVSNNFQEFVIFFRAYFISDFLSHFFNESDDWEYVINSIDEISRMNGVLIFKGLAYKRPEV